MASLDASLPSLGLVLRHLAALLDVAVEDVICNRGEGVQEARTLFCWLADFVTDASPEAIGAAVCAGPDQFDAMIRLVQLRRGADRAFRERLDDVALEIHVEAGLVQRGLLRGAADPDAGATARRILAGPRSGVTVPAVDLVHLAASYEALAAKVAALDRATRAMLAAQYTPGEKHARQTCERLTHDLIGSIPQPAKERAHG